MRVTFTDKGLTLSDHTGDWHCSMELTGWGRSGAAKLVRAASPVAIGARLEYSRGPSLKEWYLNTAWGLEQCFTVTHRPWPSAGDSTDVLFLDLALSGTLQPDLQGNTLLLRDTAGRTVFRYTGLYAFDVQGKALSSSLILAGDKLRIRVDDSDACYPITIDPWVQRAKLTASDGGAEDYFGVCVAIDGNTVAVGADHHDVGTSAYAGAVYVFKKPAGGWATTSTPNAKLTAGDGESYDRFRCSVAVSGDKVTVGARYDDVGDMANRGSAYVYRKPHGGWTTTSHADGKLIARDVAANDRFGQSIAISGDTVLVGADPADSGQGSAYVFPFNGYCPVIPSLLLD